MVKVLDQTAPALSQERTLNFEWGVLEPQWIFLGLKNRMLILFIIAVNDLFLLWRAYIIFNTMKYILLTFLPDFFNSILGA